MNALLTRFLANEVLLSSHYSVARSEQTGREYEDKFGERLSKAARLCHHVSTKDELVNCYVQGLGMSVREVVTYQLNPTGVLLPRQ